MDESATKILKQACNGDSDAYNRLMPIIYKEMRSLAAKLLQGERPNHTLQPTALVHEAYLRLIDINEVEWQSQAHFMAMAARVIRRILVDYARERQAGKRGGGINQIQLDLDKADVGSGTPVDLIALNEALEELGQLKERHRNVIELRFFGGLTIEQTAHVLGVSPETVKLDWRTARFWLKNKLQDLSNQ